MPDGQIVATRQGLRATIWKFTPEGKLLLTIARYYTPRGRSIQEKGILPDFVVGETGEVYVRAGTVDARDLKGLLRDPARKRVSLESMDAAIATARARRP
jgi:C-terminal processing protease CtpA/Prc